MEDFKQEQPGAEVGADVPKINEKIFKNCLKIKPHGAGLSSSILE